MFKSASYWSGDDLPPASNRPLNERRTYGTIR